MFQWMSVWIWCSLLFVTQTCSTKQVNQGGSCWMGSRTYPKNHIIDIEAGRVTQNLFYASDNQSQNSVSDCTWRIGSKNKDMVIALQLHKVDLGDEDQCLCEDHDFLSIGEDVDGVLVEREVLCTTLANDSVKCMITKTNYVYIHFHSNYNNSGEGFIITFKTQPKNQLTNKCIELHDIDRPTGHQIQYYVYRVSVMVACALCFLALVCALRIALHKYTKKRQRIRPARSSHGLGNQSTRAADYCVESPTGSRSDSLYYGRLSGLASRHNGQLQSLTPIWSIKIAPPRLAHTMSTGSNRQHTIEVQPSDTVFHETTYHPPQPRNQMSPERTDISNDLPSNLFIQDDEPSQIQLSSECQAYITHEVRIETDMDRNQEIEVRMPIVPPSLQNFLFASKQTVDIDGHLPIDESTDDPPPSYEEAINEEPKLATEDCKNKI